MYVVFPFLGPAAPTIWPGCRMTDTGQIVFVRSFDPDRPTEKIGTEKPWLFTFADSDAV